MYRIYVAMKITDRAVKLTDSVDTCWPDAAEIHAHNWHAVAIRRYINSLRSIGWSVDTTDVASLIA